jgi:thiopeptide-type bacteriocin biosynthesis protein
MIENYSFFPNFVLRTPLHSYECYEQYCQITDKKESEEYLINFFTKEATALFIASPALYEQFNNLKKGELAGKKKEKVIHSLLKYFIRTTTRSTPFGLFSGSKIGSFSSNNDITLGNPTSYTAKARIDMSYLCLLAFQIDNNKCIRPHLHYKLNTSIYQLNNLLRYIEIVFKDDVRSYQLAEVPRFEELDQLIEMIKQTGITTVNDCVRFFIKNEVDENLAFSFINDLIDSQILISPFFSSTITTDNDFFQSIEANLSKLPKELTLEIGHETINVVELLKRIDVINQNLENWRKSKDIANTFTLKTSLNELLPQYNSKNLLQVDTLLEGNEPKLSYQYLKRTRKAISALSKLNIGYEYEALNEFKQRYTERYGDAEVPLMQVLDIEQGLGFGNNTETKDFPNILSQLPLTTKKTKLNVELTEVEQFLLRKYTEALSSSSQTIKITDSELAALNNTNSNFHPITASSIMSIIEEKGEEKILLYAVDGSCSARLIGRFCYLDNSFSSYASEIIKKENELCSEDTVYAEFDFLPQPRVGNIMLRPQHREYYIPYCVYPPYADDNIIALDDLFVSVRNEKVYIKSKRLNKFVIPKLTHAHTYNFNEHPIYEFFGALQSENQQPSLIFRWGHSLNQADFLPRVEYDQSILSLARWLIHGEQLNKLRDQLNSKGNDFIHEWRSKFNIPNRVRIKNGDNILLIDFSDERSATIFIEFVHKQNSLELEEHLNFSGNQIVKNQQKQSFYAEYITTFYQNKKKQHGYFFNKLNSNDAPVIKSNFSIGDEWLYFKVYVGKKVADNLMTKIIYDLKENLLHEKLIDKWFFIRYADPESHLRLRFHLTDLNNLGTVVQLASAKLRASEGSISIGNVQIDTYHRETHRYGANTIREAETLFYLQSELILDFLRTIEEDKKEEESWIFAMYYTLKVMQLFRLTYKEQVNLIEFLAIGFGKEFGKNKNTNKELNKKFQTNDHRIVSLFTAINSEENDQYWGKTKLVIDQILEKKENGQLLVSVPELLASYFHMFYNRLFYHHQRMYEMVLYNILLKAIKKHSKPVLTNNPSS